MCAKLTETPSRCDSLGRCLFCLSLLPKQLHTARSPAVTGALAQPGLVARLAKQEVRIFQ